MEPDIKARLEAGGFRETTVQELLGLTDEECDLIETRLALSRLIKSLRSERRVSQKELARRMGADQSTVSRAEGDDASLTIDWLVRAAYALGASRKQVGDVIAS